MPYIYKYIDTADDVVKYVGIIRKDSNFPNRFKQHKRDEWYSTAKWRIEFCEVNSVCEAEALEGHFISLYQSNDWFNIAKSEWGQLSFAPDIEWQVFDDNYDIFNRWNCVKKTSVLSAMISDVKHQVQYLERSLDLLDDCMEKDRFNDVRNWIRDRLIVSEYKHPIHGEISDHDCYQDFCQYIGINPDEYGFDEFWDLVWRTTILYSCFKEIDKLVGVRFRTKEDDIREQKEFEETAKLINEIFSKDKLFSKDKEDIA